jgi:5,10-methylenetetrahydromethanopterin reductase
MQKKREIAAPTPASTRHHIVGTANPNSETIEVLRRLLNMERVTFEGEFHQVKDIELDVVHGRREPRNVELMIGATGPKMMELTGEIADGAVLNYCVPPEYNDQAMERLEAGAKKAGRTIDDIDRPQLVVCSVDHDHEKAIDTTRELLTQYLAQQPHIAKASGVSMDVVAEIQSILGWPATHEQIQAAKHLVPLDLIHRITASGTPDEARAKVQEYVDRGATCPILYPVGGSVELLIDTFAQK